MIKLTAEDKILLSSEQYIKYTKNKVENAILLNKLDKINIKYIVDYAIIQEAPFIEGENIIALCPKNSFKYQEEVLNAEYPDPGTGFIFEKGIEAISKDAKHSYLHALRRIGGPFPKGEDAIAQDSWYSYLYAIEILNKRFIKGEEKISEDLSISFKYSRMFYIV